MDQTKINYFEERFSQLDGDELAEMVSRRDSLADEAASALEKVMASKGINVAMLSRFAPQEVAASSIVPRPPLWKHFLRTLAYLIFAGAAVFISSVISAMIGTMPRAIGMVLTVIVLVVWGITWYRKRAKRTAPLDR